MKDALEPMSSRPTLANHASEGERSVQDPTLVLIRDLIYRTSGIFQPDNKLYFLKDGAGAGCELLAHSPRRSISAF